MPAEPFTIEKRSNAPFILARPLFMEWFKKYPDGTRFEVRFKRIGNSRSQNQNRYYWGVIVESFRYGALQEWGEYKSKEEAHETLKANCLFEERVNEETGQVMRVVLSTTENDTGDQEIYHEKCRRLIEDYFGVVVPLPGEGQVEIFK